MNDHHMHSICECVKTKPSQNVVRTRSSLRIRLAGINLTMAEMVVTYDTMRVLREFLTRGEPLCGAEIMRSLKILSGTLYPMIARLKLEGWIAHVASFPAPDQPTAHFYKLTAAGRDAFLSRLCRLTTPDHLWRDWKEFEPVANLRNKE